MCSECICVCVCVGEKKTTSRIYRNLSRNHGQSLIQLCFHCFSSGSFFRHAFHLFFLRTVHTEPFSLLVYFFIALIVFVVFLQWIWFYCVCVSPPSLLSSSPPVHVHVCILHLHSHARTHAMHSIVFQCAYIAELVRFQKKIPFQPFHRCICPVRFFTFSLIILTMCVCRQH